MISQHDFRDSNKTLLCLLLIAFLGALLFFSSIALREYNLHATYSVGSLNHCEGCKTRYEWHTASTLVFVNNWLKEGAWNLRFALFDAPSSIEFAGFEQRYFYPAYPPGAMLPIYLLFRAIIGSDLVEDFADNRSAQLLAIIAYNNLTHLLLVILLCFSVFVILRHLEFDHLNAAVLACIPAVIQFHNAHSIYWHHMLYTFDTVVLLPYVFFVFLELLRMTQTARALHLAVRILQPLLLFYGMLTDWLFVFVALTAYALRIVRGEIALVRTARGVLHFMARSMVFFVPVTAALGLWIWQVLHFSKQSFFSTLAGADNASTSYDLVASLQNRTGIGADPGSYSHYLWRSLYSWLQEGYGLTGVLLLYATAYVVWRGRKHMQGEAKFDSVVISAYMLLFLPCLLHTLFFLHHAWQHVFSALKFSAALSLSFIVLPLLVLQLRGKSPNLVVARIAGKVDVYALTALTLAGTVLYVYLQIYDRYPLTHFFRKPDFSYVTLGSYVQNNTEHNDVLFSNSVPMPVKPPQMLSMAGKVVHPVNNLDHIHLRVRHIEQDFRVRILYLNHQSEEIEQLQEFLQTYDLHSTTAEEKRIGGFLSIDGQAFVRWYEQTVPEEERLPEKAPS